MVCVRHSLRSIAIPFLLTFFVAACGGGGGGGSSTPTPTPVPDTTPDAFSFEAQTDVALSAVVESASITVAGINAAAAISVVGGEYRIGDGDYTGAASTVSNEASVQVRVTASDEFSTEASATLTIGGVDGVFTVTTLAQDLEPDAFSFAPVTGVPLSSAVDSAAVTISGINDATAVAVVGGEYSIDGGAFTSTAGEITSGQTLVARSMSSSSFLTTVQSTVTVGGVDGVFSVETEAEDLTPDEFSFADADDVEPSTVVTSDTVVTIAGINLAAPVSIVSGEYSIDGGAYTSDAGTIAAGQTLAVRGTAGEISTQVDVAVTVGTLIRSFLITTLDDTTPPTAEIYFPTRASLTEATTITVRGVASDDYSAITRLQVDGQDVSTTDNYATWSVSVNLMAGDNTLVISAEDSAGNADETVDQVTVTQGSIAVSFPNDNVPFSYDVYLDLEFVSGRNELFIAATNDQLEEVGLVLTVDANTGERTIFSDNNSPNDSLPMQSTGGIAVVASSNTAYVSTRDTGDGEIYAIDMATGVRSIFSSNTFPNSDLALGFDILDLDFDPVANRLLVPDGDNGQIVAIDLTDGSRSVFSDGGGSGPNAPYSGVYRLGVNTVNGDIYGNDTSDGVIFYDEVGSGSELSNEIVRISEIDRTSGNLTAVNLSLASVVGVNLSSGDVATISAGGDNPMDSPITVAIDQDRQIYFVFDRGNITLFVVDPTTGERVILSKSI